MEQCRARHSRDSRLNSPWRNRAIASKKNSLSCKPNTTSNYKTNDAIVSFLVFLSVLFELMAKPLTQAQATLGAFNHSITRF